jgi:hypothetical protein
MDRSRTSKTDAKVASATPALTRDDFKVGKVLRKTSFSNRKPVNTCSLSRFRKGAVFNTKHAALRVARVGEAARLFGLFAVPCAGEVRPLAANQSGSLFGFRLFGRNAAQSSLPNLFPRFGATHMLSKYIPVAFNKMFSGGQAFQVFRSVVSFVAVDVVDLLAGVKRLQPASRNSTVHQVVAAPKRQVAILTFGWSVGKKLSENFSAARNGVKVVKESVLDSVYFYAQHAVPFKVAKESAS